jgi:4-aminobutyrate aminotransferase/(S)-3-amino-2-methylpropionate transaminase
MTQSQRPLDLSAQPPLPPNSPPTMPTVAAAPAPLTSGADAAAASAALLARRAAVVPRGVPRGSHIVVDRASGASLFDVDGRETIDLASGIGVMSAGDCEPSVVAAIAAQAARLQHTCIHIATYEPYVAVCERLARLLPHGESTKVMLLNSGAEAIENAVKIARQATGRAAVICFSGAFHGRTLLGMSLTSKVAYKTGCGPFAPEVYRLAFPDRLRQGAGLDEDAFAERELAAVRAALHSHVAAEQVAAIVIEPVQGEGGFVPAPAAFLRGLRALCDEHGILLIFDEVQTGLCRTGAWGRFLGVGVTPDLSAWAKALGGGLPLAAVVGRAAVMDAALPGTIGGTFGGNPVACAAALATLDIMVRDDLNARARAIGARATAFFDRLRAEVPWIVDVRGVGAMVVIELAEHGDLARPATNAVRAVVAGCEQDGVLVLAAGMEGQVIRILAPLTIADAQLDHALDILGRHVARACA